jgi:hypothetical protein
LVLQQGLADKAIVAILNDRGFKPSARSLQRRLNAWGVRRVATSAATDELAEAVNQIFHHTLLNDDAIAARITADTSNDIKTTGRQVKSIRHLFGWLRASTGDEAAARKATTLQRVEQGLNGPGRTFGRRWFISYSRQ